MNVFTSIAVRPYYGQFQAIVTWQIAPACRGEVVRIYRSATGVDDWRLVGSTREDSWVDDKLVSKGRYQEWFYQLRVNQDRQELQSEIIGTFGRASREEFGGALVIMNQEFRWLRKFTSVLVYKLNRFGATCPACVDELTGQAVGTSRCVRCFGTRYDGGFLAPKTSFVQILDEAKNAQVNRTDGTGVSDELAHNARMLAYPQLEQHDLLIHAEADRRYVIDQVNYSMFAGKIPTIALVRLHLLEAGDMRYQIPLPV